MEYGFLDDVFDAVGVVVFISVDVSKIEYLRQSIWDLRHCMVRYQ